jgi:hypothetical protein
VSKAEHFNLLAIMERFADEETAREYLESVRWPEGAFPSAGATFGRRFRPDLGPKWTHVQLSSKMRFVTFYSSRASRDMTPPDKGGFRVYAGEARGGSWSP